MKKLILFSLFFLPGIRAFADAGDVTIINTISPKNNAFQYVVRSTNVFVSTSAFSKNLGAADQNLQHAMNTIDQLNISTSSGGGGGQPTVFVASITTNASLNLVTVGVQGSTDILSVNVSSISLPSSSVGGSGSCTNCNLSYDTHGLITAAANGSGGSTIISTMTLGATNFVFNQVIATQTNSGFNITTGVVTGVFSVVQPDDDTGDGPLKIKTFTTQEADNYEHSIFLYGIIPNPTSDAGEFVITTSSIPLTKNNLTQSPQRIDRPAIAMATAGNPGTSQGYIALQSKSHGSPNGGPQGDLYVMGSSAIVNSALILSYASGNLPVCTDINKNLTTSGCASSGGGSISTISAGIGISVLNSTGPTVTISLSPSATMYIQNTNTLQSGSTFFVSSGSVQGNFYSSSGTFSQRIAVGTTTLTDSQVKIVSPSNTIGLIIQDPAAGGGGTLGTVDLTEWRNTFGVTIASVSFDGSMISDSTMTAQTFQVLTPTVTINGTTYYWNAGTGSSGQFLKTDGGAQPTLTFASASGGGISTITAGTNITVVNSTGPNVTISLSTNATLTPKFYMPFDPVRSKLLSPGTTTFPDVDESTSTSIQSAYWNFFSTQTLTFSQILRPYQGGSLYADFYFTGSTVSTGNIGWGVFLSCNGSEFSKNVDNQLQNYTVDVTTTGTIPGTLGNYGMLEAGPLTLNSCIQGDELTVLITRLHSGSDVHGDVRLFPGIVYEK